MSVTIREVIDRMTVEVKEVGVASTTAAVNALARAEGGLETAQKSRGANAERIMAQYQKAMAQQAEMARLEAQQRAATMATIQSQQQMIAANDNAATSHSHLADILRVGTKTAIDHAASWLATAGAVGAGVLVFGGLLAILGPIILAYKLVKTGIDLVSEAWELGTAKLESYIEVAKKAAAVDLTTSYFQKLQKGAEESKVNVDDLSKSLVYLQKQSADQLGGSALDNRLAASVKKGNFADNSGVEQYAQANTLQQKFEAIVSLIHQAIDARQRLAAIDIAKTAFGDEAADNLRKNSEYFDRMVAAAAKVSDKQIVSDADIGRALDLQNRYDAAVKILEQRWHPIQDLLTQGGINMHAAWVGIVESVASVVDGVTKLIQKLAAVPAWFQSALNTGANFIVGMTTTPESRKASEKQNDISSDPKEIANVAAINAAAQAYDNYKGRLQNAAAWEQQAAEASAISGKVLKDTSHAIDDATKSVGQHRDALTRATDQVLKYIAVTEAAAGAVGQGVAAQEKAKVIADLTAAAQRDHKTNLDQYAASWEALGTKAGAAAQKLAIANATDRVKFQTDTLFMSPGDQSIASTMKNIYGPEWQSHMDDALAKQMRMNDLMKDIHGAATDFTKDFVSGLLQGKDAMAPITASASNLSKQLAERARQARDDEEQPAQRAA